MQKMLTELTSDENAQFRFNTHMEVARIASPSRSKCVAQKNWLAVWSKNGALTKKIL